MKVHSSYEENYSTSASTEMEAHNSALQTNCQMVLSCLLLESLHLGSKRWHYKSVLACNGWSPMHVLVVANGGAKAVSVSNPKAIRTG